MKVLQFPFSTLPSSFYTDDENCEITTRFLNHPRIDNESTFKNMNAFDKARIDCIFELTVKGSPIHCKGSPRIVSALSKFPITENNYRCIKRATMISHLEIIDPNRKLTQPPRFIIDNVIDEPFIFDESKTIWKLKSFGENQTPLPVLLLVHPVPKIFIPEYDSDIGLIFQFREHLMDNLSENYLLKNKFLIKLSTGQTVIF